MRSTLLLGLLLSLTLLLAACGGAATPPPAADGTMGTVTINSDNSLSFKPNAVTATAGEELTITLTNSGMLEHNLVWDNQADQVFLHTDGGETATASRTFDEPGVYPFACTIPGHKEGGMVGTLTVE